MVYIHSDFCTLICSPQLKFGAYSDATIVTICAVSYFSLSLLSPSLSFLHSSLLLILSISLLTPPPLLPPAGELWNAIQPYGGRQDLPESIWRSEL